MDTDGKRLALAAAAADAEPSRLLNGRLSTHTHRAVNGASSQREPSSTGAASVASASVAPFSLA